jgi:hypothetical protein
MNTEIEMHRLREALEASWRPDTAYLNVEEEGNPALGQCAPTSRVVQHFFPDTEIVKGHVWTGASLETHFWNTLNVGGITYHIDFSWRQFPPGSVVRDYRPLTEEESVDSAATVKRCEVLLQRVKDYLMQTDSSNHGRDHVTP